MGMTRGKRASVSMAVKAERLIKEGKDYEALDKNIRTALYIMSQNLIDHAHDVDPDKAAFIMGKLEAVCASLQERDKLESKRESDSEVVIPIMREAMEELGESTLNPSDVSQAGQVCVYRIDA